LAKATEGMEAATKAQDTILQGIQDNKAVFNEVVSKLKLRIN
jgi:formiminotetrahydrofolate cyclodeaminase